MGPPGPPGECSCHKPVEPIVYKSCGCKCNCCGEEEIIIEDCKKKSCSKEVDILPGACKEKTSCCSTGWDDLNLEIEITIQMEEGQDPQVIDLKLKKSDEDGRYYSA